MAAPFDLVETVFFGENTCFEDKNCHHRILGAKIDLHTYLYGFWTTFIFHHLCVMGLSHLVAPACVPTLIYLSRVGWSKKVD